MALMSQRAEHTTRDDVYTRLANDGVCWLTGLDASSPDALLAWAERLGTLDLGIAEELLGPCVMHLRYDPDKIALADQPAYFTADEFPLHTDVSYVPNPPDLMLMHCVRPDPHGGGLIQLARCIDALEHLKAEFVETLQSPVFSFLYPPACPAGASEAAAILANGHWRFKFDRMKFDNERAAAVKAFYQALLQVSWTIRLQSGDLLIVDNHRMVHGRTAFANAVDELTGKHAGRHIMRCYVNLAD